MEPVRRVTCQDEPVAEAYCTDQAERSTAELPTLCSSMKSFFSVAPLLPPPPYTSLMTTVVEGAALAAGASTSPPVASAPTARPSRAGRRGGRWDTGLLDDERATSPEHVSSGPAHPCSPVATLCER